MIRYFEAIVCIESSKFDCEVEFPVAIIPMNNMFTFVRLLSRATLLFHPGTEHCCKALKSLSSKGFSYWGSAVLLKGFIYSPQGDRTNRQRIKQSV